MYSGRSSVAGTDRVMVNKLARDPVAAFRGVDGVQNERVPADIDRLGR